MPDVEKHVYGIISVERETLEDRARAIHEADIDRAAVAYLAINRQTIENFMAYLPYHEREMDLLNDPLSIKVRVLGFGVPLVGTLMQNEYFVMSSDVSHA